MADSRGENLYRKPQSYGSVSAFRPQWDCARWMQRVHGWGEAQSLAFEAPLRNRAEPHGIRPCPGNERHPGVDRSHRLITWEKVRKFLFSKAEGSERNQEEDGDSSGAQRITRRIIIQPGEADLDQAAHTRSEPTTPMCESDLSAIFGKSVKTPRSPPTKETIERRRSIASTSQEPICETPLADWQQKRKRVPTPDTEGQEVKEVLKGLIANARKLRDAIETDCGKQSAAAKYADEMNDTLLKLESKRQILEVQASGVQIKRPRRSSLGSKPEVSQVFVNAMDRLADRIRLLKDRVDETPNTRREIKQDVKSVGVALSQLQWIQETIVKAIEESQQAQVGSASDDVFTATHKNKETMEDKQTQIVRVQENKEVQTSPKMVEVCTQTESGTKMREPLQIGNEKSFLDFQRLSKLDWIETDFEKVKVNVMNPFALATEAAPTIIRSRMQKEEGTLIRLLYQRCPEYKEAVLKRTSLAESKVTTITKKVAVGFDEESDNPQEQHLFVVAGDEANVAKNQLERTFEALTELKNKIKILHVEKIAIGCDITGREEMVKKMLEYIFRSEEVDVVFCVPQIKEKTFNVTEKSYAKASASQKAAKKTDALIIQGKENESYESTLTEVRKHLKGVDCNISAAKKTRAGKLMLIVSKEGNQSAKIKEILSSKMDKHKIAIRSDGMEEKVLHVKDLDALATQSEVLESLKEVVGTTLQKEEIVVTSLRKAYGERKIATVKAPREVADVLLAKGKAKIGLVTCKVIERTERIFCYRCWQPGHMAAQCKGVDRSKLCHKCGKEGHTVKQCREEAYCPVCEVKGHRARTQQCEVHRSKVSRAENKKPP